MLDIIRDNHEHHGAYRAEVEGTSVQAELTWRMAHGARVAEHTFTPPEARGKGIAQALVEALVADALEDGVKIVPACSYVAAQFKRHPEWADLLA